MGIHQPIRKIVTPEIPDKLYFRIGDVARLCEVPAYVLRFWETEFPQLKPNKGGTGQRLYRKRDVEMTLRIKSLLYDQGYTIPGARQVFKNEVRPRETVTPFESAAGPTPLASAAPAPLELAPAAAPERSSDRGRLEARLHALRNEMQELVALLGSPVAAAAPARPKALRPRLVPDPHSEPRPVPAKPEPKLAKPEPKLTPPHEPKVPKLAKPEPRLVDRRQGDLFSIE
ncbi:MAG TPA: MerR family transcriptional regulator [Acidobacteriaceae bacterium]|jgi:DNA-binding transcriptional MerR regulator